MTRAAFLGTLEIDNGGNNTLTGIRLTLDFRDEAGGTAGEKFAIRGPELSGLSAVDGTGSIGAGASGSAKYTFIPTRDAAPASPTIYRIGGTLRYVEDGQEVVVPLLSSTITVFPEARLQLIYFQQRDVFGDDPFTDEVEPAEPFALGLLVKNNGAGAARNFHITSAQPKIIENKKGLLIDFKIIGTRVGDQEAIPSLKADFGNIDAGKSKVAEWLMVSSLQGKFIDYTATFEHVDSLGNTNLSLIDSVEVHELIHPVRADRTGDDNAPDFLVNDVPDAANLPDTLYLSDGTTAVVNLAFAGAADHPVSFNNLQVHLTANQLSGWSYLQMPDPGAGFRLYRVVRSDGKEVRVGDNAWTTDRSFPSALPGAVRENLLHLLDYNGTGSYTLYYRVDDSVAPAITSVGDTLSAAQAGPVSSVDVVFSEQIDLSTFDYHDASLTLNGGSNLVTSAVTVSQITSNIYRINGLAGQTGADGNYTLTVNGGGVQDFGGNSANNNRSVSWAKGTAVPVIVSVGKVAPDPRNTPVTVVDVVFSKAINPTTFDYHDLTLTRDGGPNLVTSGVTVVQLSPTTFRIGGLTTLTAADGDYTLTVNGVTVQDIDGNAGISSLSDSWTIDTAGPAFAGIEQLTTNPRNIVVQSLDVTFTGPIDPATFDYHDLTLTRDGGANLITSVVAVTRISDTVYRISNFNWVVGDQGTYTIGVNGAGIMDLAGNTGLGSVSESWVMETSKPLPPFNLAIAPDRGVSATDGRTSVPAVTLSGSLTETNLSVTVFDATTRTDLGQAVVNGTNFNKLITFAAGSHHLQVHAADAAANVSPDVFLDVFIDLTVPSAVFSTVSPDPRSTPVDSVDVTFSEPINEATFDRSDFTLTRDGGPNLIGSGVSILYLTGNSYRLGGLTGLTDQPGAYELTFNAAGVEDTAGNAGVGSVLETWLRVGPNTPPVIAPIPNATIAPEQFLTFTVSASDTDAPPNVLTFSLDPGAPTGAVIDPTNGLFSWTPTRAQAPSTNTITVRVTDNGAPPLSATRSFTVFVSDYSVLSVGTNIVRAGQSGSVPLTAFASAGLTNLSFALDAPTNRLTGFNLSGLATEVGLASLQTVASNRVQIDFTSRTGAVFQGQIRLADLNFAAVSNQTSAFVWLTPTNMSAAQSSGASLTNIFVSPGRVVVIANEPLVEALIGNGGVRSVALYGKPGSSYQLQYSIDLSGSNNWKNWTRVPLTNLVQVIDNVNPNGPGVFFRAYEFIANPPLIDAHVGANRIGSLTLFGQAGIPYQLQYTTNLSGTITWSPFLNYTPTGSFYFVNGLSPSNPVIYYRTLRP